MNRKVLLAGVAAAAILVLASGGYGVYRVVGGAEASDGQSGRGGASGNGTSGNGNGSSTEASPGASEPQKSALECGVPPTPSLPPGMSPPPDQPIARPDNDFPMVFTMSPDKGDVGTTISAKVVVPRPQALVVLAARFFDNQNHDAYAAKFANATGIAEFKMKIPKDAPLGVAYIYASATHNNQSALEAQKFTVTGPGCRG